MNKDKVKGFNTPGAINDSLTELLRQGARGLIEKAIETELQFFLSQYENVTDLTGRKTVVRKGYLPEREVLTGLGSIAVKVPKVRDRSGGGVKFNSAIVPPYVRKARRVEAALPWLYLRGISTGNMQDALSVLLGDEAKGLSPAVVSRLKAQWSEDYLAWNRRDLIDEKYVYIWADGIYSTLRGEDDRLCLLVIMGVNEQGEKRLLALSDGYRESKASWLNILQDLEARGLKTAPKLAIGDGALGFGLLWMRHGPKPVANAAGYTRQPMCLMNCQNPYTAKPRRGCMKSGWLRPKLRQKRHLISLCGIFA